MVTSCMFNMCALVQHPVWDPIFQKFMYFSPPRATWNWLFVINEMNCYAGKEKNRIIYRCIYEK